MKNLKFFSYVLILTVACFITSCTRENISYGETTREAITRAQWSIDYYFAGQDRTAEFSNYTFSFVGNGTLKADNGTNSFNGNWSLVTDGHRNDVLSITISEALLQNINDQWKVNLTADGLTMKGTASQIHLRKL
jgi:heat shock protein HslJ